MKFSVIIPVHNREASIIKTIHSVTAQSFSDWELILVDDGSTDNTGAVCKEFAGLDERVVYLYQDAKGVSAARNNGIENARGEYILFLDSDDGLRSDALEILDKRIIEYPNADILVFGFDGADLLKNKTRKYVTKTEIVEKYLPAQLYIDAVYEEYFIEHYVWNKCYRSLFIRNNIRFDERHFSWEDGLFSIDCLSVANGMVIVPESLYIQKIVSGEDHLSNRVFLNQIDNYIKDAEMYKKRFGALYDFDTEYHSAHNIRMIGILISMAVKTYKKNSVKIICGVIENPSVQYWNEKFIPMSKYERMLQTAFREKKAKKIYKLNHDGILRKIYNRLRQFV